MMPSYTGKKWESAGEGSQWQPEGTACRYHFRSFGKDACGNGLPVTESYGKRICGASPEKCPVFRWRSSLIMEA
jgi:hypothetical protein